MDIQLKMMETQWCQVLIALFYVFIDFTLLKENVFSNNKLLLQIRLLTGKDR